MGYFKYTILYYYSPHPLLSETIDEATPQPWPPSPPHHHVIGMGGRGWGRYGRQDHVLPCWRGSPNSCRVGVRYFCEWRDAYHIRCLKRCEAMPSKHETFTQYRYIVGPASQTVGQYCTYIGWTSRVCWTVTATRWTNDGAVLVHPLG